MERGWPPNHSSPLAIPLMPRKPQPPPTPVVPLAVLAIVLGGGLQQRWLFLAPLVLLAIINLALTLAGTKPGPEARTTETTTNARWYWLLLAAAPFAAVILLGGMLPPWDYDVREYHLQTP